MKRSRRTRGFTLIEVIVAGSILLFVIGTALSLFVDANNSVGDSYVLSDAAVNANRVQSLIKQELRSSGGLMRLGATDGAGVFVEGATNLSPNGDFTSIQYQSLRSFDPATGNKVFEPLREIRFRFDGGEGGAGIGDNIDNDRDGRVDEGVIVLFIDFSGNGAIEANEEQAVLARGISGDDFAFSFPSGGSGAGAADGSLTVRLTAIIRANTIGSRDPAAPAGAQNDGTALAGGMQRILQIPLRNK